MPSDTPFNRGVVGMLGSALVLGLLLAADRATVSGDLVLEAALPSAAGAWTPRQLFIAALLVEVVKELRVGKGAGPGP